MIPFGMNLRGGCFSDEAISSNVRPRRRKKTLLAESISLDTPARIGYRMCLIRYTSSAVRYCYSLEQPLDPLLTIYLASEEKEDL